MRRTLKTPRGMEYLPGCVQGCIDGPARLAVITKKEFGRCLSTYNLSLVGAPGSWEYLILKHHPFLIGGKTDCSVVVDTNVGSSQLPPSCSKLVCLIECSFSAIWEVGKAHPFLPSLYFPLAGLGCCSLIEPQCLSIPVYGEDGL